MFILEVLWAHETLVLTFGRVLLHLTFQADLPTSRPTSLELSVCYGREHLSKHLAGVANLEFEEFP
jgi:hypothetical protein